MQYVETCIDFSSFDFPFKDFLSNLLLKLIICCIIDPAPISQSGRSVLNFRFSSFTFLILMSCSMSIEQNKCEEKIFQLQYMSNAIISHDQRYVVRSFGPYNLIFLCFTPPKWRPHCVPNLCYLFLHLLQKVWDHTLSQPSPYPWKSTCFPL